MGRRSAIVVGGGIGGLSAAIALLQRGYEVEVLERAPVFGEVGAGLTLWANGLRALDVLGLGDRVRERTVSGVTGGIRRPSGRWLARTDTAELARLQSTVAVIHRAELAGILRNALPAAVLHQGTQVTGVRTTGSRAEVAHTAGTSYADLVVGADGLDSVVRRCLWPEAAPPRYVGQTVWRFVVDPAEPITSGGETWGHGERVGVVPMTDGRVYVFLVAGTTEGGRAPAGELAELNRRFGHWHDPIPRLLATASEETVLRHDLYELPPLRSYTKGRVALLGDAAHAMTPNLGQGANQALEDAVTLAAVDDLADYDRARRRRTQMIGRRSRWIGVVAQWGGPPAALRDAAVRLAPSRLILGGVGGAVLDWHPPGLPQS